MISLQSQTLTEACRRRSLAILQARLCDALDLESQMRQLHWSVVTVDPYTLRPVFRTLTCHTWQVAEEIADGIWRLGETPDLRPALTIRSSALPPFPITGGAEMHIKVVSTSLIHLAKLLQASAEATRDLGDLESFDRLHRLSAGLNDRIPILASQLRAAIRPQSPPMEFH